jgi:rubrerythrin
MPDFGNPFSGRNSDKPLNKEELIRAMRFVIAAEYEAVQLYTQLADSIEIEKAQKVLRDVAEEEIVHAGEFMQVLKELYPEEVKFYEKGENEVKSKLAIRLDAIATELERHDPRLALAIDRISDRLEII